MIYFLNTIIVFLLSFLTISFAPYFKILGVVPMVTLFFIIGLAYFRKGFEPLIIAAFAGIFYDLSSSNPFGFYLVAFMLSVTIVRYLFQEKMRSLSFWYFVGLCMAIVIIIYAAQIVILVIQKQQVDMNIIVPFLYLILVNFVFSVLSYFMIDWYFGRIVVWENKLKRR